MRWITVHKIKNKVGQKQWHRVIPDELGHDSNSNYDLNFQDSNFNFSRNSLAHDDPPPTIQHFRI